jgi:hypothetical protein
MGGFPIVGNDLDPFTPFPATEVKAGAVVSMPLNWAVPYEQRGAIFGQNAFFMTPGMPGGGTADPGEDVPGVRPGGEEPPIVRPDRPGYSSVAGPGLGVGPFAAPMMSAGPILTELPQTDSEVMGGVATGPHVSPGATEISLTGSGPIADQRAPFFDVWWPDQDFPLPPDDLPPPRGRVRPPPRPRGLGVRPPGAKPLPQPPIPHTKTLEDILFDEGAFRGGILYSGHQERVLDWLLKMAYLHQEGFGLEVEWRGLIWEFEENYTDILGLIRAHNRNLKRAVSKRAIPDYLDPEDANEVILRAEHLLFFAMDKINSAIDAVREDPKGLRSSRETLALIREAINEAIDFLWQKNTLIPEIKRRIRAAVPRNDPPQKPKEQF